MGIEHIHEPCGASMPNWPPFGPLKATLDNNARSLAQFFQGEFDVIKCEVRGGSLMTPSIVVSFDNYKDSLARAPNLVDAIVFGALVGRTLSYGQIFPTNAG
jgi:hypothetical protein